MKLHRIVLFCRDPEASKKWYKGAEFLYEHGHDGMHWFRLGDAEVMLHPAKGPDGSGAPDQVPALHVAVDDLDGLFARMKERGLNPYDPDAPDAVADGPVLRPWGEREFEVVDPDGHRWAFTEGADGRSDGDENEKDDDA